MNQHHLRMNSLFSLLLLALISISTSCSQEKKDVVAETAVIEKPATPATTTLPVTTETPSSPATIPAPETPAVTPANNPSPTNPATSASLSLKSDGSVDIKPGQSVKISSSMSLDYVRVVSDSRCPAGAQCIWAGEVTIELKLHSGSDQQSFNLTDHTTTRKVMGMQIELLSVDRANLASIKVSKI